MIVKAKKSPPIETGVVMEMGMELWHVWYKGVGFGEFNSLPKASERLQKLMDLDNTREIQRKEEFE